MDSHKQIIARFASTIDDTFDECGDTVLDYEGNEYKTVQIGDQCWMAENLKKINHDNGEITHRPNIDDWDYTVPSSWAYYDNDSTNNKLHGKLYSWVAATQPGLCPQGWHLPTDEEWKDLELSLGMSESELNDDLHQRGESENVGGKLKLAGTKYWESSNFGATNESGFSALPSGRTSGDTPFAGFGIVANFWTSTKGTAGELAFSRGLSTWGGGIDRRDGSSIATNGKSIRCVLD
ncbi:MAG: fibrobacter succinogenes major paralogous domain-containing protein [Balneolaceae bacterium]|nr:fibrobacter succinogenes major paralogous domain-containing protein [Balneolaceae bacterium]